MIRILYSKRIFVLLLIGISTLNFARDVEETFLRGNKCYEQGNYDQALLLYQSLHFKGPAVWFNMGNCAHELGNDLDALVYWRKAERYATKWRTCDEARRNIALCGMGKDTQNLFGWSIHKIFLLTPLLMIQLTFLVCWIIFLMVIRILFRRRRYVIIVMLSILIVLCANLVLLKYFVDQRVHGIIIHPHVSLYAGPQSDYHVIGFVDEACDVSVHDRKDQWVKIKYKNMRGWIQEDMIAVI